MRYSYFRMLRKRRCLYVTIAVGCLVFWASTSRTQLQQVLKIAGFDFIDKGFLRDGLVQLEYMLKIKKDTDAAWQLTRKLIRIVDGEKEPTEFDASVPPSLEVCPEEWLGSRMDHPFFFTSWKQLDCTNVLPFEKVLTIILYHPPQQDDACPLKFQNVLKGIKTLYPKIPVLVSGVSEECVSISESPQVHWMSNAKDLNPGIVWNKLIEHVSTPYVLVGRDMDDFLWTINLERQVRMISYNPAVSVAGGAVRNFTGHWRVGCWQMTMRNYILEFQEGYYASSNSCLFCDYLLGPFVARTKVVRSIKFDASLPSEVLFEDWFWRLKQKNTKVVDCPDVMYLASDSSAEEKSTSRIPWLPLVRKWGLNRIVTPRRRVLSYTCEEAGLSCKNIRSILDSFLMPICCVEQFGAAVGVFNDFCRKHNLRYELEAGSVLGVVKMNDLMPWDVDGEISIYGANMSLFFSSSDHFKKHGVLLGKQRVFTSNGKSYFNIYTPDLYFEMWGETKLSHDFPLGQPFLSVPTQVLLHGHWVYAPHSPGAYVRNRYGIEIFRHSQNWIFLGMKDSWAPYKSGYFKKCEDPKHHACLDHFSVDGNIQFHVPN